MRGKIVLDRLSEIRYNKTTSRLQESPSGMASASQADSGGFDSRFLLQHARSRQAALFFRKQLPKLIWAGRCEARRAPRSGRRHSRFLLQSAQPSGCAFFRKQLPKLIWAGRCVARRAPRSGRRHSRFLLQCAQPLGCAFFRKQLPKLIWAGRCEARRAPRSGRRLSRFLLQCAQPSGCALHAKRTAVPSFLRLSASGFMRASENRLLPAPRSVPAPRRRAR